MPQEMIAIIGAGHMGSAIIGGLIAAGHQPNHICASRTSLVALQHLQETFGIQITQSNYQCAEYAEILILAVKPALLATVCQQLAPIIRARNPLVISVTAGVLEATLRKILNFDFAIIRAMPNTPALIRCGATALYANAWVTTEQLQSAQTIFAGIGTTLWLTAEEQLFAVTALSGSGPAYFFLLMDALEKAAARLDLPPAIARPLILQTALGSAKLAIASEDTAATLCQKVASPGGGTEQALAVFNDAGFFNLVYKAVKAAKARYKKLSAAYKEK